MSPRGSSISFVGLIAARAAEWEQRKNTVNNTTPRPVPTVQRRRRSLVAEEILVCHNRKRIRSRCQKCTLNTPTSCTIGFLDGPAGRFHYPFIVPFPPERKPFCHQTAADHVRLFSLVRARHISVPTRPPPPSAPIQTHSVRQPRRCCNPGPCTEREQALARTCFLPQRFVLTTRTITLRGRFTRIRRIRLACGKLSKKLHYAIH